MVPVSYTHLDVYKRQWQVGGVRLWTEKNRGESFEQTSVLQGP